MASLWIAGDLKEFVLQTVQTDTLKTDTQPSTMHG